MAITQYTEPATVNPSLTDWQNSIARDNASSRGFAEVDLSSYADGATAPTVAVGSRFDNNGALYVVSGTAESITGIAGIANSTTFYVYYDVSAGVFSASTTAPTFDKEKRGWYNGNDRALFRIYKDGSGNYDQRLRLKQPEKVLAYRAAGGETQNDVFNILKQFVPNVNDEIRIVLIRLSTQFLVYNHATRTAAGVITLYGSGATGGQQATPINSGSGSTYDSWDLIIIE